MNVLLADDDAVVRELIGRELRLHEIDVVAVGSGEEAVQKARSSRFDVVLLDLLMPGMSGIDALKEIRCLTRPPEVVLITGNPEVETAVQAMRLGAHDYLCKPVDVVKLQTTVRNAAENRRLRRDNTVLKHLISESQRFGPIISDSSEMKAVLRTVERIASAGAPVLICGETGTGKGLIAKTIHAGSPRCTEHFVPVNCASLQETLLESELFGHEKGAFTGAVVAKEGLFEVADGGTLFLDEIGEMSLPMQAKLLQVLDSGELRRVGGTNPRITDVRIVAATNRDLWEEVRASRFREDLFFRLNVVRISLPPLRQRKADVPGLVRHYLRRFRQPGRDPKTISNEALQMLIEHSWPGNVREIANAIEGAVLLSHGDVIEPADLPGSIRQRVGEVRSNGHDEPLPLFEIEKVHILRTLQWTEGKKAQAADLLGINVKTLNNKLKRYGAKQAATAVSMN